MVKDKLVTQCSRLLHDLTGILKLLNRDDKICYGLTWPQAFTIETLSREGRLFMSALGERLGVKESTATRILNLLVRDNLVERKPGEQDRRQVSVSLTEAGRTMARKLVACREKGIEELLSAMTQAQRKSLIAAMETVTAVMAGRKCC
jgi:DNA-binding MarR family transcriptional regulator